MAFVFGLFSEFILSWNGVDGVPFSDPFLKWVTHAVTFCFTWWRVLWDGFGRIFFGLGFTLFFPTVSHGLRPLVKVRGGKNILRPF